MKPFGNQLIAELMHCSSKILNDRYKLEKLLSTAIEISKIEQKSISSHQFNPIGVTVISIVSESHIAIHTYPEARHVSIDIFTCSNDHRKSHQLLKYLEKSFKAKTSRTMKIFRGNPLAIKEKNWITAFSGYGFETRYHIKKNILSKKLKYQKIDIIENENFGRMLFLDNELQIAEYDADIYHANVVDTIIKKNKKLENILILGGGDGGLLYETLKYNPKAITVVEIEKEMPQICKKYLRCICQDAFNKPNIKIVNDDANDYLKVNIGFDAIIYDLTMHPASLTNLERKVFLNQIFRNIKNALKKGGILSLQCCPEFDEETYKVLRPILLKKFSNVKFKKAFIPSFSENLIFATAKK